VGTGPYSRKLREEIAKFLEEKRKQTRKT